MQIRTVWLEPSNDSFSVSVSVYISLIFRHKHYND